jgi:hypothetical protein
MQAGFRPTPFPAYSCAEAARRRLTLAPSPGGELFLSQMWPEWLEALLPPCELLQQTASLFFLGKGQTAVQQALQFLLGPGFISGLA